MSQDLMSGLTQWLQPPVLVSDLHKVLDSSVTIALPSIVSWVRIVGYATSFGLLNAPLAGITLWSNRSLKSRSLLLHWALHCVVIVFAVFYLPLLLLPWIAAAEEEESGHCALLDWVVACSSSLQLFRFLESALGVFPAGADASLLSFCAYIITPTHEVQFGPDGKRLRASLHNATASASSFLWYALAASLCATLHPLFSGPSLAAEYVRAALVCCWVGGMGSLGQCNAALTPPFTTGVPSMRNPMLESRGVNDFWGRRWNLMSQRYLKRTLFEPVLKLTGSRALGTVATFAGSAAFHEGIVYYMHTRCTGTRREDVRGMLGYQTAFFLLQALLCMLERRLGKAFPQLSAALGRLPGPVQTLLTTGVVLPAAPLFTLPYLRSGMLPDYVLHVPRLLLLPR